MENHPIPQDVTGFKFRLIGSMTVRQFSYILAAGILSYLFYSSELFFFLKYPAILCFILLGIGFAFVPIDGRPLDKMIFLFIQALPRENEYIYRKKGSILFELIRTLNFKPQTTAQAKEVKAKNEETAKKKMAIELIRTSHYKPDEMEQSFLEKLKPFLSETVMENSGSPVVFKSPQKTTTPDIQPQHKNTFGFFTHHHKADEEPEKEIKKQEDKIIKTQPVRPASPPPPPPPAPVTSQNETQVTNSVAQEVELLANTEDFRKHLAQSTTSVPPKVYQPTSGETTNANETPNVHKVSVQNKKIAGFPVLPDVPNVVLGIVKDSRGKVIPNIIVEVLNKQSDPVRAFKTNLLGQFISATPLQTGTYKIAVEDPQRIHEFDTIEISLDGKEIFSPLEIISVDERERLRKELFDGGKVN